MKKFFAILITVIAVLSMTACGDAQTENEGTIYTGIIQTEEEDERAVTLREYLALEGKDLVSFDGVDDEGYWMYHFENSDGHDGYGRVLPAYAIGEADRG